MAPFSLLMVSVLLYGFRQMYGEAITALPLNGGSYNVLINTTSKVGITMMKRAGGTTAPF